MNSSECHIPTRTSGPTARGAVSPRVLGVVAAAGVVAAIAGVVVVSVARERAAAREQGLGELAAGPAVVVGGAGVVREARIELIDKALAQRTGEQRLLAEITAESIDSAPGGTAGGGPTDRVAVRPRAWLFAEDGRTVYVEAERGVFAMPDAQTIERGTLEGGVRVRVFAARANGARPDPASDVAEAKFTTESPLRFDLLSSEVSTAGRVRFEAEGLSFVGGGLNAVVDQVNQRLQRLTISDDGRLLMRPKSRADEKTTEVTDAGAAPVAGQAASPGAAPTPEATQNAGAEAPKPRIDQYHVVARGEVRIRQGTRWVDGHRLAGFVRLVDGKVDLPERTASDEPRETVRRVTPDFDATGTALGAGSPSSAAGTSVAATADAAEAVAAPLGEGPEDVVLWWSGWLSISPLKDEFVDRPPPELSGESVHVSLTPSSSSRVTFQDSGTGQSGSASEVVYRAANGQLLLTGDGGDVWLSDSGAGSLSAPRVSVDVASGLIVAAGPGLLKGPGDFGSSDPLGERQRLSWADQAVFEVATGDSGDGSATGGSIRSAMLYGDVAGESQGSRFTGTTLQASFAERDGVWLESLRVTEAELRDAASGSLTARTIDVDFADPAAGDGDASGSTGSGTPTPRRVVAAGAVVAHAAAGTIICERLDATLAQTEESELVIELAAAEGNVEFLQGGVTGTATRLLAWPLEERVALTGVLERPTELVSDDGSILRGQEITLDARARRAEVIGAGELRSVDANGVEALVLTWRSGLVFNDALGSVECVGDVVALFSTSAGRRDEARAPTLSVQLGAASEAEDAAVGVGDDAGASGGPLQLAGGDRAIEWVQLTGDASSRAVFISRDGAAKDDGASLRLSGGEIAVDTTIGTVSVPGAGELVIVASGDGGGSRAGAGDSLMTWDGWMRLDQSTGRAQMRRGVRVTHRAASDGRLSLMDAESLTADMTLDASGPASLQRLRALGAVYLRSGETEVIGDEVTYDAVLGLVEASAAAGPDGGLSLIDARTGGAANARRLRWSLVDDQIVIDGVRTLPIGE